MKRIKIRSIRDWLLCVAGALLVVAVVLASRHIFDWLADQTAEQLVVTAALVMLLAAAVTHWDQEQGSLVWIAAVLAALAIAFWWMAGATRTGLAWLFVAFVLAASIGGAYWTLTTGMQRKERQRSSQPPAQRVEDAQEGRPTPGKQGSLYRSAEPPAKEIKTAVQMVIGVAAVCIIGWHFIAGPTGNLKDSTGQLLDGIGVALAAAAVIELAYTLFTEGPDEALNPLMLAIAATLIIQLGKYPDTPADAADLLLLGSLLALLFIVRLALSEQHDEPEPNIWWVKRLMGTSDITKQAPGLQPGPRQDRGAPR